MFVNNLTPLTSGLLYFTDFPRKLLCQVLPEHCILFCFLCLLLSHIAYMSVLSPFLDEDGGGEDGSSEYDGRQRPDNG